MKIKEKIASAMNAPKDLFLGETKTTIFSNNELLIENYKGILEYSDDIIKIKLKEKEVILTGDSLEINEMTDDMITITGTIKNLEYME